jgi:hypothetical protein
VISAVGAAEVHGPKPLGAAPELGEKVFLNGREFHSGPEPLPVSVVPHLAKLLAYGDLLGGEIADVSATIIEVNVLGHLVTLVTQSGRGSP